MHACVSSVASVHTYVRTYMSVCVVRESACYVPYRPNVHMEAMIMQ